MLSLVHGFMIVDFYIVLTLLLLLFSLKDPLTIALKQTNADIVTL